MKHLLMAISMTVAALTLGLAASDADAKRLGAGKPAGMQRAAPTNATPQNAPANTAAAPSNAAAPVAAPGATPPKRNWMGPLAGLAAGLGIAALFSHLGMGAGLGNFVMIALLAVVAVVAVRFIMGRMRGGASSGPQLAGAGAGASAGGWQPQPAATPVNLSRSTLDSAPVLPAATALDSAPALPAATALAGAGAVAATAPVLPGGMDAADFERLAKMVFIRLQAANDASNLDDLRKFTTPELFASLRLDLQDRAGAKQQTDVVQIDAKVVECARENGQDIVTVRFTGLIREAAEAGAEPFNELWHLVRAADGHGDWAIAGITPVQ